MAATVDPTLWTDTIYGDATFYRPFKFKDDLGVPIPITGWQFHLSIVADDGGNSSNPIDLTSENGGFVITDDLIGEGYIIIQSAITKGIRWTKGAGTLLVRIPGDPVLDIVAANGKFTLKKSTTKNLWTP